jgi:sugar phosphate isomerase/epimerase
MDLSMWSNFYHDLPFDISLKKIKENGFDYCELSDSHFITIIEKRQFDEFIKVKKIYDIKTPQVHAPICSIYEDPNKPVVERLVDFSDFREDIRKREVDCIIKWIEYCKIVGIECIVVHPGGLKGYDNFNEYKKIQEYNIEGFKKIGEKCEKEKIKIAIENMGGKPPKGKNMPYGKVEELMDLIEKVSSNYIGICIDTSHANISKVSIPEFIEIAKEKIYATHISDNLGENDDHLCPFSGKINWDEVINSFKKIKYNGIFNFEIPGEVRCPLVIRDIKIKYVLQVGDYLVRKNDRNRK